MPDLVQVEQKAHDELETPKIDEQVPPTAQPVKAQEEEVEDVVEAATSETEEASKSDDDADGEPEDETPEPVDASEPEVQAPPSDTSEPSLRVKPSSAPMDPNSNAFTAQLDAESLAFFNEVAAKPFADQAVEFLNAYWNEVGDQAEFIFSVAWETMRYADMHTKGVNYIHLYDEGNNLDFNIGLYFYEKLCKKVLEDEQGAKWRDDPKFAPSMPSMMTAIKRKKELRDKVDVNFDGRVSFLEYLLYQYRDHANPADFTHRAMKVMDIEEHPEIVKARTALEAVNAAIREFEKEKQRLEELAKQPGVKGLSAKHLLAALNASPLAEELNTALIKAEAAVRMATRKFKNITPGAAGAAPSKPTQGSIWWMNRDLEMKKKLYGKKSNT